jgi:hypothetical protein
MHRKVWFGLLPLCAVLVALVSSLLAEPVPTCCGGAAAEKKDGKYGTLCPLYKFAKQGGYWTYYAEICSGTYCHYDTTVDGTGSCAAPTFPPCVPNYRLIGKLGGKLLMQRVAHDADDYLKEHGITPGAPVADPIVAGSPADLLESRIVKCYMGRKHTRYAVVSLYTALFSPPAACLKPQRVIRWGIEIEPKHLPAGAEEIPYLKLKPKKGKKVAQFDMADALSDFQVVLGQEPEDP